MNPQRPPTIDPQAAARWASRPWEPLASGSPWLHEEVARRMEDRLQWMTLQPQRWLHWEPLRGGVQAHALIERRYPRAECFVHEADAGRATQTSRLMALPWWSPARWRSMRPHFELPAQPVQLLWANMALHMAADPQAMIAQWHSLVAVDGFLMFSCLGPDTLRELRQVYAELGWPPPSHEFTDMHDWGDMLVRAGFAEPVMDMERITLSFASPQRLLVELRELGRNLHPQRGGTTRGRGWRDQLHTALTRRLSPSGDGGALQITFEIIYGHAFKPPPRLSVGAQTAVSLDEMRATLRQGKKR